MTGKRISTARSCAAMLALLSALSAGCAGRTAILRGDDRVFRVEGGCFVRDGEAVAAGEVEGWVVISPAAASRLFGAAVDGGR